MPLVSKTIEVTAPADAIMGIVADFEAYPQWNEEITGLWILARYEDGRPSQLRLDTKIQGMDSTFIQAVYYPADFQIQTVLQQGDIFAKQEQLFAAVPMGDTTLLTVEMDVEVSMPGVPSLMVKKIANDALDHLADNLKKRAESLGA
ncbi:SRPBCC family protein [Mycobacterium sp. BMJ-28]